MFSAEIPHQTASLKTLADIVEKPSRNKENLQNSKLEKYL